MRGLPADQRLVTPRRLEVLRLAASGYSNADIARKLWLSEDAVKSHFRLAYEQLGARDRSHAVAICLVRGLIHPHEVELLPPRTGSAGPQKAPDGPQGRREAASGAREGRTLTPASGGRSVDPGGAAA